MSSQEKRSRSVKIWELDSDNSDVKRDCFDEFDTDKLLESLGPIGILSMHSCCAKLSFHKCVLHSVSLVFLSFLILSHFLNPNLKTFYNFLLQLNMARHKLVFLVLWVLTPRAEIIN